MTLITLLLLTLSIKASSYDGESRFRAFSPDGIPFTVAEEPWDIEGRGHHRAVVEVKDNAADAVTVTLPWRRADLRQDSKKIVVTDASTGKEIKNVSVVSLTAEKGTVVFEPVNGQKTYYIYYLACHLREGAGDARYGDPWNDYLSPEYEASTEWLAKTEGPLPEAKVLRFEDRTRFDSFGPMGIIATAEEKELLRSNADEGLLVFPEDRAFPIKLFHDIPARWAGKAPEKAFAGVACRNEYYCFQLGVWAAAGELENVKLEFSDLKCRRSVIPSSELTCFNTGGTNWDGEPVEFRVDVPEGDVQALWCGVQIPRDARKGKYSGTVTVSADGVANKVIPLKIKVKPRILEDKGDGDLWRHARLRWLNSTIGLDNHPTKDFDAMTVEGLRIGASGKKVTVGAGGLVDCIEINDKTIFQSPMAFTVVTGDGKEITLDARDAQLKREDDGLVSWKASSVQDGIRFNVEASMEFDGFIHYDIGVSSDSEIKVKDVRLETGFTPYASEYFMGIGLSGGERPANYSWDWNGWYDSYWTGGALAGLHFEFLGGEYHGPLINDYRPAPAPEWYNGGRGRVRIQGPKGAPALVTASTGSGTLSAETRHFQFNMIITPARNVNTEYQFSNRYYHDNPEKMFEMAKHGANVQNIHHARKLNPYINYPFIVRDSLIRHIEELHQIGCKTKLYYTIREMTTHCEEIFALKSLKHEIFTSGVGYGLPWDCEHLIDDYKPAWYTQLDRGDTDAAIVTTGVSRFINYWLEGLRWMCENYKIDGIYMDDVSFDRFTVKRIRKVLDSFRDGAMIDLHSNTAYSNGAANQYADFFPYLDRLWFGESFKYNEMNPDEWFVTFSGIPFGLMSDMLQDKGNRFLGTVYGATSRTDLNNAFPIWEEWDKFGISQAEMLGYWDASCPVSASDPLVKVTVFKKDGKSLLAIGNFSEKDKCVTLNIDFDALGINPSSAVLRADRIDNFQDEMLLKAGDRFTVPAKKGFLLTLK